MCLTCLWAFLSGWVTASIRLDLLVTSPPIWHQNTECFCLTSLFLCSKAVMATFSVTTEIDLPWGHCAFYCMTTAIQAQCFGGLYELFKFFKWPPPIDINISVLQNKNWSSKKVSYLFKKYSGKGVDLVFKTSSLISNPCVLFFPYCFPTFHQRESSGSIPASPIGSFLFLIHYHSVLCVAEDPSSLIPNGWEQKWIPKCAWPLILYSSISIAT